MKNTSILIVILILICQSQFYSQTKSEGYNAKNTRGYHDKEIKEQHKKIKENSKGLSLKIKDLKSVQKNGKTSWTAKANLINHSRDTLFYFITKDCEAGYYLISSGVDSIQLFTDFKPCDSPQQTVIAIPPSGQRTIDLEVSSQNPVPPSFKIRVYLSVHKAKNMAERFPHDVLMRNRDREIWIESNQIKI